MPIEFNSVSSYSAPQFQKRRNPKMALRSESKEQFGACANRFCLLFFVFPSAVRSALDRSVPLREETKCHLLHFETVA